MDDALIKAIYAVLIAFGINTVLCPIIIPVLIKLKYGQNIRHDGPETHLKKAGTPTMGGVMILLSFVLTSLIFADGNPDALMALFVTVGFGIIGLMDDFIKVVKKRSLGLKAMQKIIFQLIISTIFMVYLYNRPEEFHKILVPFTDGYTIDMGIFYIPFVYFVIVGTVNSVNLTDGLDGLAAGVTAMVATFFMFVAWAVGSTLLPVAGAAVGALMGFLLFNSYPAKVIMGDTGSFALGGFVVASALLLKMPVFLAIVGVIYVAEALSDIIQVSYFKMTHGKRIFKMAPLHHHFEKSGWNEIKVVAVFYIVTAIACLVGFLGAKNIFF